jgi:hypothetical protein
MDSAPPLSEDHFLERLPVLRVYGNLWRLRIPSRKLSALFEQRDYRDSGWVNAEGEYLTTTRGLFIKASYLYRF